MSFLKNSKYNFFGFFLQYMTSSENTESLYRMFSQLLDRKLRELKKDPSTMEENGDDIKEDYMAEFIKPGTSVSTVDLTDVCYHFFSFFFF